MMYHFMFGFLGGSGATAATSAAGVSAPLSTASFFSSSCIACRKTQTSFPALPMAEVAEHPVNSLTNQVVHRPEVNRENEHGDNDYRGRGPYLFEGRRGDLLHFGAEVVIKRL